MSRWCISKLLAGVFAIMLSAYVSAAKALDFDHGQAPLEVVVPTVLPTLLQVYPGAGDASLVLRATAMISNSWFDAIAPYHPTAVGVYSRLERRPPAEGATNRNKNVAILYASYRVLNSLLPAHHAKWRAMLTGVGLDPYDTSEDPTTAVGIGNLAGKHVVQARENDGMNQLGNVGCKYNCRPYADYTGYKPVNTAYELLDPSRWQPNVTSGGNGIFQVQQFVTPQWRKTRAYTFDDPRRFTVPAPKNSDAHNRHAYRQQADEVLAASAGLTDHQKMLAEFFNNKLTSLGLAGEFIVQSRGLDLDRAVQFIFMYNLAEFDGGIATWNQKYRWDAVRPFSAIRYLYGDQKVTAWGGPGRGTVNDLPGAQWRSYLPTADHPEYPSGSACFCAAHAQVGRRFLGSDVFGWSVARPRGSSVIEPGITPASDIALTWGTYTEWENQCAYSRVYGGVHFTAAVIEGQKLCRSMGDRSYELIKAHVDGTVR